MVVTDAERMHLVNSIAKSYESSCIEEVGDYLESFYVFGSYAFGKISLDIPDINYFLLLKEGVNPDAFIKHAAVLHKVVDEYADRAQVMVEFRPFRYIYPNQKRNHYEVFICPQLGRMEDRSGWIPFGWGWVFGGVLATKRLLFGNDALAEVRQPQVSYSYIKKFFREAFFPIWTPLERAPQQYRLSEESELLFHEALKTAQMAANGFGVNLALTADELRNNVWLEYVSDKSKLVKFYEERYDEHSARNVELMLDVRDNWLLYKDDPAMALKMFHAAIEICDRVKRQYRDRFLAPVEKEVYSPGVSDDLADEFGID